jgi:hypothetical protein
MNKFAFIFAGLLGSLCGITFIMHFKNWLPEIFGVIYTWAPLIFGFAVTLGFVGFGVKSPKVLLIAFVGATVAYFLVQVL